MCVSAFWTNFKILYYFAFTTQRALGFAQSGSDRASSRLTHKSLESIWLYIYLFITRESTTLSISQGRILTQRSANDPHDRQPHLSVRANKYTDIFNARNLQQCILDVYPRMLTAWANRLVRLLDAHHHRIILIIIFWVLKRDQEWVADALAAPYSLHSQQVSFDLCSPSSNQKFTEKARDSLGCLCDKCTGTRHCKCGTHHFVPCAPLNRAWKWHTMCAFYVAFDNFK